MGGDQEKVINAIRNQTNNTTHQCANLNVGCINKDALMKVIRQLYVFKTLKSLNNRQTEVLTSPFNWHFYTLSVPAAHFYTFMVFTVNSSKQRFGQHFCFSKHTFNNSLFNATLITRAPWFREITEQSQKNINNENVLTNNYKENYTP